MKETMRPAETHTQRGRERSSNSKRTVMRSRKTQNTFGQEKAQLQIALDLKGKQC